MRTTLLVFLALCLTACGTPLAREPDPTPGSVFLAYPPYLQPTADRFSECAIQQSGLSIFLIPDPAAQSDLPGALLQLQVGGEIPNGSEIYQIGEEKITFIVNGDNPAEQLSTEELLAIYTGQQVYWGFGNHPGIEVWSYPNGDALRSLLETLLPGIPRVASQAQIAPDPQGILQKVAADSGAIGYVPGSWLAALGHEMSIQVKVIRLENSLTENLIQPVLVTSSDPLSLEVRALLACLQQPED